MTAALFQYMAEIGRFLRKEFVGAWPVFLFFLTGFLLLLLMIKLALADLSVQVSALSNAVVGALLAAKAALLLDETRLAQAFENYRRIFAVAVKTFIYGLATLLLGYLERLLEALRRVHSLDRAIHDVIGHASHNRLLAWSMGISIVFALYFASFEINQRIGEGGLRKIFFESPAISETSDDSWETSGGYRRIRD